MNVRSSLGSLVLTAVSALVLAGCGHGTAAAPATTSAPPVTTSSPPPVTTASVAPSTSEIPTTTTASASPTPTTLAPTGPCTTAQLAFTLGSHATSGTHTTVGLNLRNTAAAPCTVRGNPAVDVVDSYGMQAGPAAAALPGDAPDGLPATVTLAHGATARANFSYVAAVNGGASCSPDTAARLLVFAPGSSTSASVPFAVSICTAAADRPGITPVVAGS